MAMSRKAPDLRPCWWELVTAQDAGRALAFVVQEVLAGRLDPRAANAVTGAASALVNVVRSADLEARLQALEGILGPNELRRA
jgi:hypothetical protein